MGSSDRQLVKIIKEICLEHSIEFSGFSSDWILQLKANDRIMFIYGYKFPQNDAAIEQICSDKSALSDILQAHNFPHVPHYFFTLPSKQSTNSASNWDTMMSLLQNYGSLVCKPNKGTGGKDVFRVSRQSDLEAAVHTIFSKSNSMCIAPYRRIKSEYRVIVVNGEVGVIYEKKRPTVCGNGINSLKELIFQSGVSDIEIDSTINLNRIPVADEVIEISWKHNLGQGAKPVAVTDSVLAERLASTALACSTMLDAEFASFDIIDGENGLEILEVNSGVMMEKFAKSSSENYLKAKAIYEKAILHYLKMDDLKYKYFVQQPRKHHFVLPILDEIARERGIQIIPDVSEGNFSIFQFSNGKRFVARDYPFNINYAGTISLCTNKSACSEFLATMGFNIPKQKYFVKKSDSEITISEVKRHLEQPTVLLGFNFPMIIKPNGLSQGAGVYKISNVEEGLIATKKVMALKEKLFVLQEFCEGHDYRIVVLDNTVIQAYERIPFQVTGNGHDTIETLIKRKVNSFQNAKRDKAVDISDSRITRNIINQGYTLQTILQTGVSCRLQDVSNLSLGGTTEDKFADISTFYKDLSVKIAKSLNLKLCGIDIIAQDITDPNNTNYSIIEVNSAPGLDNYVFEGEKQDQYVKSLYEKVFDLMETL